MGKLEATEGIEPPCTDLQSAASPLRHVASRGRLHKRDLPFRQGGEYEKTCRPASGLDERGLETANLLKVGALAACRREAELRHPAGGRAGLAAGGVHLGKAQFAHETGGHGRIDAAARHDDTTAGGATVGAVGAGGSAALMGAVPAASAGGLCTLAVVGLWTRLFPSLWKVNRFEDAQYQSLDPMQDPTSGK